jgi:hypothetical protein
MPGEDSDIEGVIGAEVPQQIKPRDQAGKFIPMNRAPEPIFGLRPIEGDPVTGDVSDGGDDPRLRARERDLADGWEGNDQRNAPQRRDAPADDELEPDDEVVENLTPDGADADDDKSVEAGKQESDDQGEKYEITVEGNVIHVSFGELKSGYVRQQTFHKRMTDLNTVQSNLEGDADNQQKGWQLWHKARQDYEEDLAALIPKEPNWDEEFAKNPQAAHTNLKIFQALYNKLAQSRQARADREIEDAKEADRRLHKYAVEGFAKFVAMHPKIFPNEQTLKKNITSMRHTALTAGFSEQEVATVFDPRMLTILLKASKYDRISAAKPKVVAPEQGRALRPGSTTPLNGNVPRKGLEEALRRQASSGRLDDTAEVFRRGFLS